MYYSSNQHFCVNIDLVVPLNTLLVDDDSKRINKPGNNMKHQQHSHSSFALEKKRAVPPTTPWNVKLRTRLCTMVFGQAALRFKVGQRVKLLNRPVLTLGTILYVGKLSSDGEGEKPVTTKKSLLSVNHDYLGVELDRSGKFVTQITRNYKKLKKKKYNF